MRPQRTIRIGGADLNSGVAVEFAGLTIPPDGKSVLTAIRSGPYDNYTLELGQWNASTGEQEKKIPNAGGHQMLFTADGRNIVVFSNRSTIEVRDSLTLQKRLAFAPHTRLGKVAVALSPDGQTLATACLPTDTPWHTTTALGTLEVRLWDATRSPTILAFPALPGVSVRFTQDGRLPAEMDRGRARARVWDLATGRTMASASTTQHSLGGAFSPDGRTLIGADVGGG